MADYSFYKNIYFMVLVFKNPRLLIDRIVHESSYWYGIVPFIIYILACEAGWLSAYFTKSYQAINPLPKFFPIPDEKYLLYQAVFGPFIKAAGVFIFLASFSLFSKALSIGKFDKKTFANYYLMVGNTLALVAIAVDQIIVWGRLQGTIRFLVSTIHPIVFVVAVILVIMYVHRLKNISIGKIIFTVLLSMILSGPIPGLVFR
jgi:hypothetical protein